MRRQGRELALQILFQIEFTPEISVVELLDLVGAKLSKESVAFAKDLVDGVSSHKVDIDGLIQGSSHPGLEPISS